MLIYSYSNYSQLISASNIQVTDSWDSSEYNNKSGSGLPIPFTHVDIVLKASVSSGNVKFNVYIVYIDEVGNYSDSLDPILISSFMVPGTSIKAMLPDVKVLPLRFKIRIVSHSGTLTIDHIKVLGRNFCLRV